MPISPCSLALAPRADLRARAHEVAASIASRDSISIQGTVRAIWESLDMTRTMALHNGMAYTHIGNPTPGDPRLATPMQKKAPPTYR